MVWSDFFARHKRKRNQPECPGTVPLAIERLESRTLLNATAILAAGVLTITDGPGDDRITVCKIDATDVITVLDGGRGIASFASASVNQITINALAGNNVVRIENNVLQPATITGGPGNDVFYAGGGPTTLDGDGGFNKLVAGSGPTVMVSSGDTHMFGGSAPDSFTGGAGNNLYYNVRVNDSAAVTPSTFVVANPGALDFQSPMDTLTAAQVGQLLARAAGASSSNDAIIAVVDREGNILGVRVEGGVSGIITGNQALLGFAIDGAVAEARTGAFFSNNQAPLTSRTIQEISQSTITEREVNAYPFITDPNSTVRGPGYVAPVGVGDHFPPGVPFTPQVDLFAIEHTNRDGPIHPGPSGVIGFGPDILLTNRFNVTAFAPGKDLPFPLAYNTAVFGPVAPFGSVAQNRGIGTLPGGIPIFDANGVLVGGIGVFFPGTTGFATEENSSLSQTYDPSKPDRTLEAEYMAFAAVGGSPAAGAAIGTISGVPPLPGFGLPNGRIDLVGITLDIVGPGGRMGITNLLKYAATTITPGDPNSGTNEPVNMALQPLIDGTFAPEGYLVAPANGTGSSINLTANDVAQIVTQGLNQANQTRAQIRTPAQVPARFVYAIVDTTGNVIGLFRTPDADYFSIDVAVAKARNVAYYANPSLLQPQDRTPQVPAGVAFTSRTFRYEALPRFPEGIDGAPPGPFSILNDGGANPLTGLQVGPPLPASAYQSVLGYDSFHPETNFRDPANLANQNGVVFFPGSMPLYKQAADGSYVLVGGLGVSGDGVDEDDVATFAASAGFGPPSLLRADNFSVNGIRLPFQHFDRNPEG